MVDPIGAQEALYRFCPTCATPLERRSIDGRQLLCCPRCSFVFWNNPKLAVCALIEQDGNILMLKRATEPFKDHWVFPGGYVNTDEAPTETAIREAKEETALDFVPGPLIGVYQNDNDPRAMTIELAYSGTAAGEIHLESIMAEARWFDPTQLPEKIGYKHRQVVTDWQLTGIEQ